MYCNLKELFVKTSMKEDFKEPFKTVCDFYSDNFKHDLLQVQLLTFEVDFSYEAKSPKPKIFDVRDYFKSLSAAQRSLMSEVCKVMQLV